MPRTESNTRGDAAQNWPGPLLSKGVTQGRHSLRTTIAAGPAQQRMQQQFVRHLDV